MSISERYRKIVNDVQELLNKLQESAEVVGGKELRMVAQAAQGLADLQEQVGEIPRIRLESKLTPVLLKAHTQLDRARLLLEEQGVEDWAACVWEMEQRIYRLLNDL
jgi:hypothetical protein